MQVDYLSTFIRYEPVYAKYFHQVHLDHAQPTYVMNNIILVKS